MGKKGGAHTIQVRSRASRRLARSHSVIERDALTDADEVAEAAAAVVRVLGNAFLLGGRSVSPDISGFRNHGAVDGRGEKDG